MATFDLAIVGAGPAGCAAAITARRAGLAVVVIDKAAFPRDKTCGDGLTTNALRLVEALGLSLDALIAGGRYARVRDAAIVSPSGRTIVLPLPSGRGEYAAVVPRLQFDAALVEHVRATGVDVATGVAVRDVTPGERSVELALESGEMVTADWVIAADGHWSPTRRTLQPARTADLGTWHAARQYFSNAGDGRLWVLFERDLLPGYFWVFPLPDGRANVGFGVLRDHKLKGRDLKALWPDLLARPTVRRVLGPDAEPEGTVRAWPIPTRYAPDRLTDRRVLFAGDAAGVVDPMTGEGIAQALETGMLAATAVADGGAVAARYTAGVEQALGHDLRFAHRLQRLLGTPLAASGALRAAGLTSWTRRNFARWMFEDYPRAVLLTPSRWHRGVFSGSGAFGHADSPRWRAD